MIKTIDDFISHLRERADAAKYMSENVAYDDNETGYWCGIHENSIETADELEELKRNMQQSDVPDNRAEKDRALLVELSRLDTYAEEREHEKLVEIIRKHLRENP